MHATKLIAAGMLAATLAGCAGDPNVGPRQQSGAAIGALAGGVLGAAVAGGGTGKTAAGAAIGAVAGGILGGAIGQSLDEQDRQRAYEAEMQALEYGDPGAPVGWRSARTGYYGTVVPGPAYDSRGMRCREYTHTIYIGGRPETARGTACRNPDGSWTPIS
jgi:surface antigen